MYARNVWEEAEKQTKKQTLDDYFTGLGEFPLQQFLCATCSLFELNQLSHYLGG